MANSTLAVALGASGGLPAALISLQGGLVALGLALAALWWLGPSDSDWGRLPGPPPANWLLGHLQQVNVQNVHRFFQDAANQYGALGMYKLRLLHTKVVILCSPELVQAVVSRSADLPKSPEIYDGVDELFSLRGHRSFFNTHSYEEWRLVRKGTAPAFSLENTRKAFPLLLSVTDEVCDRLAERAAAGKDEVDVTEDLAMRVMLDVFGQMGYGYDFNARAMGHCDLMEAIPPLLSEFTLRATNPLRRVLHMLCPWLPAAKLYNEHVATCHNWWGILLGSVRALDLQAADAAGDTSLRACLARLPLTDELLLPQIAVYLVAGFETTSHSIGWVLYEVARNPEVQAKLEEELREAGLLGPQRRPLEFADLASLRYMNWVLKEAMRLHPVASTGTVRKAPTAVTLGGYRIPRGTIIWAPFITLLTSKHNWERPDDFWPERWELEEAARGSPNGLAKGGSAGSSAADLPSRAAGSPGEAAAAGPTPLGNASLPGKSYLPFSDGPRDCLGQNLAMAEARAVLAAVVGRFSLQVAPRMGSWQDVRDQEVMKLTLQCRGGIHLRFTERT